LKVSFPPFIFELDLLHEIDDNNSTASVGNSLVVFKLPKIVKQVWGKIAFDGCVTVGVV
jgi:hypothetical protein